MSETKLNKEFWEKVNEILSKVFEQGQLMVIATKQHGKTNACMWLMRALIESKYHEQQKIQTIIFDTVLNWRFKFDKMPFVDYEGLKNIPEVQDLIVDMNQVDTQITRNAVTQILMNDFLHKRKIKKETNGDVPFINVYLVEEMQNVWGTYALSGFEGRFALKIFSECANYGQIIIGIGQRLGDISPKIVERTRYFLFGATSGDNDLAKIRRMSGGKQLAEQIRSLKKGEFIFYDKESGVASIIGFPKFKQKDTPYPYKNGETDGYVKTIFIGS